MRDERQFLCGMVRKEEQVVQGRCCVAMLQCLYCGRVRNEEQVVQGSCATSGSFSAGGRRKSKRNRSSKAGIDVLVDLLCAVSAGPTVVK